MSGVNLYPREDFGAVATCVAEILAAYWEGAATLHVVKEKRAARRAPFLPHVLEEAILQSPEEIQRESLRGIARCGERFELGDAKAVFALQRITISLQSGLLRLHELVDDDAKAAVVAGAADLARDSTIASLVALRQRLQAQPTDRAWILRDSSPHSRSAQSWDTLTTTENTVDSFPPVPPGLLQRASPRKPLSPPPLPPPQSPLPWPPAYVQRPAVMPPSNLGQMSMQTPSTIPRYHHLPPWLPGEDEKQLKLDSPSASTESVPRVGTTLHVFPPRRSGRVGGSLAGKKEPTGNHNASKVSLAGSPVIGSDHVTKRSTSFEAVRRPSSQCLSAAELGALHITKTIPTFVLPDKSNDYLGFCRSAWKLQCGEKQALNKAKDFSQSAQSKLYYLTCSKSSCAFKGRGAKAVSGQPITDLGRGLKYRWVFFAKCHVYSRSDNYSYLCMFCVFAGRSPVTMGGIALLDHISRTHRTECLSEALLAQTQCVQNRICKDVEEFDINVFPILPASLQR